jgi:hypothetical protein
MSRPAQAKTNVGSSGAGCSSLRLGMRRIHIGAHTMNPAAPSERAKSSVLLAFVRKMHQSLSRLRPTPIFLYTQ